MKFSLGTEASKSIEIINHGAGKHVRTQSAFCMLKKKTKKLVNTYNLCEPLT